MKITVGSMIDWTASEGSKFPVNRHGQAGVVGTPAPEVPMIHC